MQNPSTDKFYQLIRKNRDSTGQKTSSIVVVGKEMLSPEKQRKAFADNHEDLSVPKDNGYDLAYLELCNVRHDLIKQICEESSELLDPITPEVEEEGIFKLNTKKSPDESGLASEHLKYSGPVVNESITNLFNQILQEKLVSGTLKAGILTSVLNK